MASFSGLSSIIKILSITTVCLNRLPGNPDRGGGLVNTRLVLNRIAEGRKDLLSIVRAVSDPPPIV